MKKEMTILIIEDDRKDCEVFLNIAKNRNDIDIIRVTKSSSDGVNCIKNQKPDCVILDIELPKGEGSGIEFLNDLKRMQLEQRPIIAVNTNTPSGVLHNLVRDLGVDIIYSKRQKGYDAEKIISTMLMIWKSATLGFDDEDDEDELYYENMSGKKEDKDTRIMNDIKSEMDLIGIGIRYVGRKYLEDAILLIVKQGDDNSRSVLYDVADKYDVSYSSVIRSIQTAINNAWKGMAAEELAKHYTARVSVRSGVPSPTEFVYFYANKISKGS